MPSSLVTRAARGEVKKPATARTPAENMRYGGSFGQALWGKVSISGAKWARLGPDGEVVGIRIRGIMGFSGFFGRLARVFKCHARVLIRLGGILGYAEKRKPGEIEILILTKPRGVPPFRNFLKFSRKGWHMRRFGLSSLSARPQTFGGAGRKLSLDTREG